VGSIPSAFAGVLLLRLIGPGNALQHLIQVALAVALVLAALGLVVKGYSARRRPAPAEVPAPVRIRPLPTALLGAVGGLVVGLTSVGSGSLIIVVLLVLYPSLRANDLVGTDLVQAIPLVAAAALGHAFFGDLRLDIAAAVLVGSVPGVLLGARLSARAPAGLIRSALVVVLLASALKLFGLPNVLVVSVLVVSVVAGVAAAGCARALRQRLAAPPPPAEDTDPVRNGTPPAVKHDPHQPVHPRVAQAAEPA